MNAPHSRLLDAGFSGLTALLLLLAAAPTILAAERTSAPTVRLRVNFEIEENIIRGAAEIEPGDGEADFFLFDLASELNVIAAHVTEPGERPDLTQQATHVPVPHHRELERYKLRLPDDIEHPVVVIVYQGALADDVEAGEIAGQVHNFSVQSHISPRGVFLSESSCWYPCPASSTGGRPLANYEVTIQPTPGWVFVASGDPAGEETDKPGASNVWRTPRPTEGVALAGNRLQTFGGESESGVEIVAHLGEGNSRLAPMFLGAVNDYLALYEPLLGPYPYKRFTIMENFFSSGFAYPGFTLMDARVLAMGPRALMPGLLDHELLHNWWGNGVYISPADGNWCEAITSHNANMSRYGLEGNEQRSEDYRRGNLMKLAADPSLDPPHGCPLDEFGRNPNCHRYVGYDKGAMVFHMIRRALGEDVYWTGLKRFSTEHMGKRATWDDLVTALDPQDEAGVHGIVEQFVRRPGAPPLRVTNAAPAEDAIRLDIDAGERNWSLDVPMRLYMQDGGTRDVVLAYPGEESIEADPEDVTHVEIDPDFHLYRLLPPEQVIPTILNTQAEAMHFVVSAGDPRPEVEAFIARYPAATQGAAAVEERNLFILGEGASAVRNMLAEASNPFTFRDGWFEVEGARYDEPTQAVMHSFRIPDDSGRYATLFYSNGEVGWEKLRLVTHYRRDTTIVWEEGAVIARHVHEPDRRVPVLQRTGDEMKPAYD